jgi:hypothetical protein
MGLEFGDELDGGFGVGSLGGDGDGHRGSIHGRAGSCVEGCCDGREKSQRHEGEESPSGG